MIKKNRQYKNYGSYENELEKKIAEAIYEGKPIAGKNGILTPIIKKALEAALEGEINDHMEKGEGGNKKNGKSKKIVKSSYGAFELETPRDRKGYFNPEIVKKRQTILTKDLDEKIFKLFSKGMSYRDIEDHVEDMYGIKVDREAISNITNKLLPIIEEWQTRPLEEVYPVIFLDASYHKVRDSGSVETKAVCSIIGINIEGRKEVLGSYVTGNEGSKFWLEILTDLANRGVKDVLIACVDGLKGFPEAIGAVFPKATVQLCVVHQIRHSLLYVSHMDKKEFAYDLKSIYTADTKKTASSNLTKLSEKWKHRYPSVINSWQNNWELLSAFFAFNKDIRRVIYTTNIIENFHRIVRKFTKNKSSFPSENSLMKMVYLAAKHAGEKWTMPIANWQMTISQFDIAFEGRLKLKLDKKSL